MSCGKIFRAKGALFSRSCTRGAASRRQKTLQFIDLFRRAVTQAQGSWVTYRAGTLPIEFGVVTYDAEA